MSTSPALAATIGPDMMRTLTRTTWRYWVSLLAAAAAVAVGGWAWADILKTGFGETGMNHPAMWGVFITNFVFFIGVSHAGTLVSAILYFTRSPIRAGVGRSAEAMTVIAIMTAGLFPIIHLGRTWLFYWLIPYPSSREIWPNFHSPLVWDLFAICSYVTVSALFLYMGMLPDLSTFGRKIGGVRRTIYKALSLGFASTDGEWQIFEKAYPVFAAVVIPLAVSVHSVVSWDFAMAITPGWHSTIFAPYFVAGAIFSGLAMAIILLALLRRFYGLGAYIGEKHFDVLARLMLGMSLIMTFVYVTEYFLAFYRNDSVEKSLYIWRAVGTDAPWFWAVIFCNSIAPLACFWRRVRSSAGALVIVSVLVTLGMWLERYVIVVTGLTHSYDPFAWRHYVPSLHEMGITLGACGWFALLFMIFVKVFPSISVSETKQSQQSLADAAAGTEEAVGA